MFDNLDIQWAGTLLGCLAAVMIPIPVIFYLYGERIRGRSKFAPAMARPVVGEVRSVGNDWKEETV